jgi:hypothetical protein
VTVDMDRALEVLYEFSEDGRSYIKARELAKRTRASSKQLGAHIARNPDEWPLEDSGFGHPTTYRITLGDE